MQQGDWTTDMAIRAAWMSFVGGATQGEIATRLGISNAKVHRLIAHAQRTGLVRFQIAGRPADCRPARKPTAAPCAGDLAPYAQYYT